MKKVDLKKQTTTTKTKQELFLESLNTSTPSLVW